MGFFERLSAVMKQHNSWLCVGLDSASDRLPVSAEGEKTSQRIFNRLIVEETKDLVCAYKPNLAFYEAEGVAGLEALRDLRDCVPAHIPIIGDAKRGDIGNTSRLYARAIFETLGFDAVTVNPLLGFDSVEPFLEYDDKGVFLLCLTSNPGAADFQLPGRLFREIASRAVGWNTRGNIGLVVGATQAEQIREIREAVGDMPFLVPGIGSQGGDLEAVVRHGPNSKREGIVINVSRKVIFASGEDDFGRAARAEAQKIRDEINSLREKLRGASDA